jgi:hypothetical protein
VIRFVAVLAAAAVLMSVVDGNGGGELPAQREEPTATPVPPVLRDAELNQQDRTSAQHRRREAHAFDTRPLLEALPTVRQGVRIDVGGLADDGRTVVLRISPGSRDLAHARGIYRRLLVAHLDAGTDYRIRWER